jgi:hypothetical protein
MLIMQTHKETGRGLKKGKTEVKKVQFQVLLDSVSAQRERGRGQKNSTVWQ